MAEDQRVVRLFFPPTGDGAREDPSLTRIRSVLRLAHSDPSHLISGGGQGVTKALEAVRMHALATAAERGEDGYSYFKGKDGGEDEILSALKSLPVESLRLIASDLSYLARYSRFESVRIAAAFCLDS